jgi:uncharacterized membrane protein YcjF (UPF0283 family)
VIEFNRDAKRILVSHLRTWEERKEAPAKAAKKAAKEEPQVEMPKVEKTTLGDLSALAELKASMEAEEKPAKKAATKKAAAKKEHRLGIVKIICSIAGVIASVALGVWSLITTMKFEETGTVRTSAGKLAQGIAKGAMAKLENCKKDL